MILLHGAIVIVSDHSHCGRIGLWDNNTRIVVNVAGAQIFLHDMIPTIEENEKRKRARISNVVVHEIM
jgi:hypothetical protein